MPRLIHSVFASLLLCTLLATAPSSFADSAMVLEKAWIAEAPPMSKVMAAYMQIQNPGAEALEITKIASADFSSIEIHRTVDENGVARMLRQNGLSIAAQSHFELQPGGYHLMLFNPGKAFKAGDHSQLIFTFIDGSTMSFDLVVKKTSDYASHGHH